MIIRGPAQKIRKIEMRDSDVAERKRWENKDGDVIEGDAKQVKRQKDVWTFSKDMSLNDPNWQLVATDE